MIVRPEEPKDVFAIREITIAAFENHPFSRQTEHLIIGSLRSASALVSLVAEDHGTVVGHIALSPAAIGDTSSGWYLLGPVSVHPDHQGQGIGRALIEAGRRAGLQTPRFDCGSSRGSGQRGSGSPPARSSGAHSVQRALPHSATEGFSMASS